MVLGKIELVGPSPIFPLTLWGHNFLPQIPHAAESPVGPNLGTTNQIGLIGAPKSVPMFLNSVSGGRGEQRPFVRRPLGIG